MHAALSDMPQARIESPGCRASSDPGVSDRSSGHRSLVDELRQQALSITALGRRRITLEEAFLEVMGHEEKEAMRPYLAIIADSFREALASRVLWILLVLITLLLAALVPLGYRSEQTAEFRQGDFLDARALVEAIHRDFDQGRRHPATASGRSSARTRKDAERFPARDRRQSVAVLRRPA